MGDRGYDADVFCHHPETSAGHRMANGGFEAARNTLKKRCPAKFAGMTCDAQDTSPVAQGIRIALEIDRRVFTPIDRGSYTWEREYAHRTAVERVNSRLDVSFGFELHTNSRDAQDARPLWIGAPGVAEHGARASGKTTPNRSAV